MKPIDLLALGGGRSTPYVQQSEASECGLACIAMIAGHHGRKSDMPTLRRRFSLSLKGTTLKALMHIAEEVGFHVRALRGEMADLRNVPTPAILHWDLKHFVVLTKVTRGLKGRRFHIHDPARGRLVLNEQAASEHFTGVVLELAPSESFQRRSQASQLRISQLWSKLSGLWLSLRQVLLLSIVLQVIALASPFYMQVAIDTAFPSFDADLLLMLAAGFGGLALINMLTTWIRSLTLVSLGSSLSYQIVVNLNRHLLRLPLPWYEKRHVGDIISRFGSTKPISDLLSQGLIAALMDGAMAFATLILMFIYSPLLAGIAVTAWMLFAGMRLAFIHALRMRNVDAITTAARENSCFIESVRGISGIKAFGQEGNRQRIWQGLKADAVNAEIKLGRLSGGFDAAGQFILGAERVLFVYIAISLAMGGLFTVGMIFAFQAYKQQFLDASTRLVEQLINYRLLDVHLNRIADIALTKPEASGDQASARLEVEGQIDVQAVGFRYGVGERDVLKYINLRVAPGEMIALVGPSGGGKTTLLKIMMGLFEPTYGQVLVDGHPMSSINSASWRSQIGSVTQNDQLYAGTIGENIAFFDPEIDMNRVKEVARLSSIHDDIAAMPMGYETLVGDMGSVLSGGQKQRVLLARALYPDPKVLFIDEGTAHLDPISEHKVMQAIRDLPMTRIISAHRPAAFQAASKIYVVERGTLSEKIDATAAAAADPPRDAGAMILAARSEDSEPSATNLFGDAEAAAGAISN